MLKLILIASGGAIGATMRYLLAGWTQRLAGAGFPLGTLTVNAAGCFAIGALMAALAGPFLIREEYRLALLVGVLGGFTTFSTFGYETFALLNEGQWARASANIVLSNGLGLIAVWAGYRLTENWYGV